MKTIVLDAGHGGSDPGATYGSYQEKNYTLDIALRTRDHLLGNYEVQILMTRTTDTYVSLSERVALANNNNADYFCSIHVNAGGGTGWESYIWDGPVSQETFDAQDVIHGHVMGVIGPRYGVRDRGQKRANFYVLRETNMPAILLENLFIDTAADRSLLNDPAFRQDLAVAIGDGIAKARALPAKDYTLYKVIAGSFQNRSNAEDRKNFLIANGIDAFVWEVVIDGITWYRVQAGAFRSRENAEQRLQEVQALGISDAYILVD